jgi:hypothetical protein
VTELQGFSVEFPTQINRESISENREFLAESREFIYSASTFIDSLRFDSFEPVWKKTRQFDANAGAARRIGAGAAAGESGAA